MNTKTPLDKYLSSEYVENNPSWDMEDSPWKAARISKLIQENAIPRSKICEVGCGAGGILRELQKLYPASQLSGYDIAPAAARFWSNPGPNLQLEVGDFVQMNSSGYDILLSLDVLEHVENPFEFLRGIKRRAKYYIFHFPLDLSALSVLRESPLLLSRNKVGHIHYFTKNLALALLKESGFTIIQANYSGAAFNSPQRSAKTMLASFPRRAAYFIHKDFGARLLGGETLFVLASD